jgi:hypothetical protein
MSEDKYASDQCYEIQSRIQFEPLCDPKDAGY